jgi:hypothetical protein
MLNINNKTDKSLLGENNMALTSPGVQVSVIDESFYTPAEPGTRPLFIVASAEGKANGSGTGTAAGTLAANAGKVYLITSQRDLVDTFGDPTFHVDSNNNPIHAGELNEYGLQAAYSYLGVSNSAFVVRADIDLDKLQPSADAPGGDPIDGTFWLDTASTTYGIFEWNGAPATSTGGQSFTNKVPTLLSVSGGVPANSTGAVGSYALVYDADGSTKLTSGHEMKLYYKSAYGTDGSVGSASWVLVGSNAWATAHPIVTGTTSVGSISGGEALNIDVVNTGGGITSETITVAGTTLDDVANEITGDATTISARVVNGLLEIYAENTNVDGIIIKTTSDADLLAFAGLTADDTDVHYAADFAISKHTSVPLWKDRTGQTARPSGSVWVKITEPNLGARWRVKVYNETTQLWDSVEAPMYATSHEALADLDETGGVSLALNTAYIQYNFAEDAEAQGTFRLLRRAKTGATSITSGVIGTSAPDTYELTLSVSVPGDATLTTPVTATNSTGSDWTADDIAEAVNSLGIANLEAVSTADDKVIISHTRGGEIRFSQANGSIGLELSTNNSNVEAVGTDFVASNWAVRTFAGTTQTYYIDTDAPATLVADGELWYSSVVDDVDLMIHDGNTWVGYGNGPADLVGISCERAIVSASTPTMFESGNDFPTDTAEMEGQIWIDTSDLENYPIIKRWNNDLQRWIILDKADQTSENGVLFGDARWTTDAGKTDGEAGDIDALFTDNFLDFDAPDPNLYPRGMILWNLRRSGFNVKKFVRNYVDLTDDNIRFNDENMGVNNYYPHRWVTESGNLADGSGAFGRHAQRKVVIQSLQALVNSNADIRDTEVRTFNLMATPGYPELIGEMVTLNYDRGLTAFVVGDSPARLTPDATTINDWGNNVALALQDDDSGLVSFDEYLGVFYPWGFTSDNAGNDVAVPPSHMILRMMALSDQVSYPWFAPAGTRRGGITNATAVGYVDAEGEFVSVALNEGQRDTLYNVKVNPITFFTGAGLVNFGQKTRARNASALDRINVARLVIYLRSQLNKLAKPYIFEPNDKITRDEIKQQVESLMLELVGQRALYDFLVVCDESNNTPNRIDRNELYVDIAIEPVKAVEFIYIPVRLKNTGEIAGL